MRWNAPNRGLRGNASCVDASEPRLEYAGAYGKHAGSAAQMRFKGVEPRLHVLVGPVFIQDRNAKGWEAPAWYIRPVWEIIMTFKKSNTRAIFVLIAPVKA